MYFSTAVVATLSLLPIFAVPKPLITVTKYNDNLTGRHIVSLRPGVTPISFLKATNITAIYKYTVINGFAKMMQYGVSLASALHGTGPQTQTQTPTSKFTACHIPNKPR
ncbi:hypothetical protein C0991_012409 [Blastosporella zonata]|nr:hypothetical protein C0991_012409 [Blastosporella zonata]